jgi:hypothetical protein
VLAGQALLQPDMAELVCRTDLAQHSAPMRVREEPHRPPRQKYGDGIQLRCRQALMHYAPLADVPGIDIHQHSTTLYNSIYLGDDCMIVNAHRFGINAYATPLLHLQRASHDGLFSGYADSFEQVWQLSYAVKWD